MFFFRWFQLSLHEDSFGVPSVLSNFFCCFHLKHWGNTDDEERRCKYRRRREASCWCENDFAYLVLSWKVHDTQEQLSLSFTLAFSPLIFSFTHPSCPFFSRHHSEGVLLLPSRLSNVGHAHQFTLLFEALSENIRNLPIITQVSWTICVQWGGLGWKQWIWMLSLNFRFSFLFYLHEVWKISLADKVLLSLH